MSHTEALERIIQLLEQKVMKLELDLVNERLKNTPAPSGLGQASPGTIHTPFIGGGSIVQQPFSPYYGQITIRDSSGTQTCESIGASRTSGINQAALVMQQNGNLQLIPESQRNRG